MLWCLKRLISSASMTGPLKTIPCQYLAIQVPTLTTTLICIKLNYYSANSVFDSAELHFLHGNLGSNWKFFIYIHWKESRRDTNLLPTVMSLVAPEVAFMKTYCVNDDKVGIRITRGFQCLSHITDATLLSHTNKPNSTFWAQFC